MKELGRVTHYDVLQRRQNGTRTLVTEYMGTLKPGTIRTLWDALVDTRPKIIAATSLVLAARTHEDLNFLILKELYRHKTPFYQNSVRIFTDEKPDPEKLTAYEASEKVVYPPLLRGTEGYRPDRQEEVAVGKNLLQALMAFRQADQNFDIRQTITARLLTQFALVAEGQHPETHQNLKCRLHLASYLATAAMGARNRMRMMSEDNYQTPMPRARDTTRTVLDRIDEELSSI